MDVKGSEKIECKPECARPRAQQRTTFERRATNRTASAVRILLRPRTGALRRGLFRYFVEGSGLLSGREKNLFLKELICGMI